MLTKKSEEDIEPGYVLVPYKVVNTATYVNGKLVWHRNKFINLGLKIRRLFRKNVTPDLKKYSEKTINPEFFGKVVMENKSN